MFHVYSLYAGTPDSTTRPVLSRVDGVRFTLLTGVFSWSDELSFLSLFVVSVGGSSKCDAYVPFSSGYAHVLSLVRSSMTPPREGAWDMSS